MAWEEVSWRGVEIHTPGADADYEPYGRDPWVAIDDYLQLGLQPVAVASERWPQPTAALGRATWGTKR